MKLFKLLQKLTVAVLIMAALFIGFAATSGAEAATVTSSAGVVTTSSTSLNVRSSAGLGGSVIKKLPRGSYVTLIYKTGNWWYVEYAAGKYGYVSADYIRYVYGTYALKVSTSSGSLNVRSGPGASYGVTGTLPSGRTVLVLSENGGWYKILCNGTAVGYVHGAYLKSMMAWPVPESKKINQYFGSHKGIDIGSSVHGVSGDAVTAAQPGKVVYAGWLNGYGYVVYINSVYNGLPIQTRYGHLASAPLVSAGDMVGVGQRIGYMGSTGTSSGVHLHFEVRNRNSTAVCIANADSTAVNPMDYLN